MNKLIDSIKCLGENWMHKSKKEKVTGIREALVDLDDLVYRGEITQNDISSVLTLVNSLMLKLHDEVEEV